MNSILILTFLTTGILTVAGLATLPLVIAGIHREERHMTLSAQPDARTEALARKILDVHISQPDARLIFAARHADIARHAPTRSAVARPEPRRRHPSQPRPYPATFRTP
jgi:hypothetical protein